MLSPPVRPHCTSILPSAVVVSRHSGRSALCIGTVIQIAEALEGPLGREKGIEGSSVILNVNKNISYHYTCCKTAANAMCFNPQHPLTRQKSVQVIRRIAQS